MSATLNQKFPPNLNQQQLIQAVMENLASAPSTGTGGGIVTGRFYYDTTQEQPFIYTSSGWTGLIGVRKNVTQIGDGVSTTYTITHNWGTRDISPSVRLTASPYSWVDIDMDFSDPNFVTVYSAQPLALNQLTVVLLG